MLSIMNCSHFSHLTADGAAPMVLKPSAMPQNLADSALHNVMFNDKGN